MIHTIQTKYANGKIDLSDDISIPNDSTIFISFKDRDEDSLFLNATESSLEKIWDNKEDDVYEQLLKI